MHKLETVEKNLSSTICPPGRLIPARGHKVDDEFLARSVVKGELSPNCLRNCSTCKKSKSGKILRGKR